MITNYKNVPCVVKHANTYYKTNKTASFFSKHREMNDEDTEIYYIDESINDRALIDKALTNLEKKLKGEPIKEKETFVPEADFEYQYRVNVNTVYCSHSKEGLQWLLDKNKINVNVNELYA